MTAGPDHARVAYEVLSDSYDLLTTDHDYANWTLSLERLARAAGLTGRRLLDVACGTGKSFLPFLERGFEVTACDISPRMVEAARAKAGDRVTLSVQDMRELPVLGAFDLVLCLDDAANYLLEPGELPAALAGMARNLAPGGVAIWDLNTIAMYRGFYAGLSVVPREDRVLIWRGDVPRPAQVGERVRASLEILSRDADGAWQRAESVHLQRHHPEPVVRGAVAGAGLRLAGVHGMTTDGTIHDGLDELAHTKAIYVATAR
jgi:SAM-dependent methyltransferase